MRRHPEATVILPWPEELKTPYFYGFRRALKYMPMAAFSASDTSFIDGQLDGFNFRTRPTI